MKFEKPGRLGNTYGELKVPSLFIVGNLNEKTFANAVLAAHTRALALGGEDGLTDIFVLHTPESERKLADNKEWKAHLSKYGVSQSAFSHRLFDFAGGDRQLTLIARHVEQCVSSLGRDEDIFVDLTNGTSLHKSILGSLAFVLGARRQFVLQTPVHGEFLAPAELEALYLELPDPSLLDAVAPSWLTQIRRFRSRARAAAQTFEEVCGADSLRKTGFEDDLLNAVDSWFRGEKRSSGSTLGGAVRYAGRAFEDLVQGVFEVLLARQKPRHLNLAGMLDLISEHLRREAPAYEPRLREDVAHLLRTLRNESTHQQTLADFGRLRAKLSTELLLTAVDYVAVLHRQGIFDQSPMVFGIREERCQTTGREGELYFFGLDGDDTGAELQRLFLENAPIDDFSSFSKSVDRAVQGVAKRVRSAPINGRVIFSSGDDILFKGRFNSRELEALRALYCRLTGGHTCSIGFGQKPQEAYVALKIAKATPGKNAIRGIALMPTKDPTV